MNQELTGTVLIVDDEDDIRLALSTYAQALGLNVVEATNGEEAIEIIGSQVIDLVVSDLLMPKIGGIELLENLRGNGYFLPFIIVTAYSTKEFTTKALRLGAFDFIEKPFQGGEVKHVIKQALEVSMRQKTIENQRLYTYKSSLDHIKSETAKKTASAILNLQSLRYAREEATANREKGEEFLRDMFFSEVANHLISCRVSIQSLSDKKLRDHELVWLLRTMQTIQVNAESIGLPNVALLAEAFGTFCSHQRVYKDELSKEAISLLSTVNEFFQENIKNLGEGNEKAIAEAKKHTNELQKLSLGKKT